MKCCISTVDLILLGVGVRKFPTYYDDLLQDNLISGASHLLLQTLWNDAVAQLKKSLKQGKLDVVVKGSTSSFALRAGMSSTCVKSAVKALTDLKLVKARYYNNRLVSLELSAIRLFNELVSQMVIAVSGVSLFDLMYSKLTCSDREVLEFGRKIKNLTKRLTGVGNPVFTSYMETRHVEVCRQPIITQENGGDAMLRQPIILNRIPIQGGVRKPIHGTRIAIFDRVPIKIGYKKYRKLNLNAKKYEWLTDAEKAELLSIAHLGMDMVDAKLERFKNHRCMKFSDQELDCLNNLIPYYENLICQKTGEIEHPLIKNHYIKKSRHWKSLWNIYTLCVERSWDYKVYLESQFESFSNWGVCGDYKWPLPNTLLSERAIKAFEAYIYRNETSYQKEGYDIKAKSKNVGTFQQEVEKKVQFAIEVIQRDLTYWSQSPLGIFSNVPVSQMSRAQKTKAVIDHWMYDLPAEYLATIPDFLEYVGNKDEYVTAIKDKLEEIEELQNNMVKMRIIIRIVRKQELENKLPKTLDLMSLEDLLNTEEPVELW